MNYQLLENFIKYKVRKGDIYIPSAIVMMLKNSGSATIAEVARLLYIFEYKHNIKEYETIAREFSFVLLDEYGLIKKNGDIYTLIQWPLNEDEISRLISLCYSKSNGFFKNLDTNKAA